MEGRRGRRDLQTGRRQPTTDEPSWLVLRRPSRMTMWERGRGVVDRVGSWLEEQRSEALGGTRLPTTLVRVRTITHKARQASAEKGPLHLF